MHRSFLVSVCAAALAFVSSSAARAQDQIPYGQSRLGLSDEGRDGTLYIPKSYKPGTKMPLLIMLHGFSGWGDNQRSLFALAEELGFIVITPESRDITWGKEAPGFDQDVRYIGAAFRHVGSIVNIDFDRVALGGQSDGAGYALTMGLAYGDTFNHVIVLAGGGLDRADSTAGQAEDLLRARRQGFDDADRRERAQERRTAEGRKATTSRITSTKADTARPVRSSANRSSGSSAKPKG